MTQHKQMRGGSWVGFFPRYCRSAYRDHLGPGLSDYSSGFRVVCNEEPPLLALQLRGGSWNINPRNCRSAYRVHVVPSLAYDGLGFRVVCNWEDSESRDYARHCAGGPGVSAPGAAARPIATTSGPATPTASSASAWSAQHHNQHAMTIVKALRGGSWGGYPRLCRSACRTHFSLGFRVVCNEKPSPSPM